MKAEIELIAGQRQMRKWLSVPGNATNPRALPEFARRW